jgi:hypothetical protein
MADDVESGEGGRLPRQRHDNSGVHVVESVPNALGAEAPFIQVSLLDGQRGAFPGSLPQAAAATTISVPGWPSEPAPLARSTWIDRALVLWDAVVTMLPLLFLVFAVVAARLDGQPLSAWGERVRQAANLGPTIFPVLFAVIVRRMLRALALWRAERGARLGTLEQLMGSGSIFGTLETQFLLRSASLLGAALFAVWALSPVGGQASLRVLEIGSATSVSTRTLWYVAKEHQSVFYGGSPTSQWGSAVGALYQASLLAPEAVQQAPEDTWGNVKIPYLEKLDASTADRDGWVPVPTSGVSYSSLLGLPVIGRAPADRDANSSHFIVETQYFTLDCPIVRMVRVHEFVNSTLNYTRMSSNMYLGTETDMFLRSQHITFSLSTNTNWTDARWTDPQLSARKILWQSLGHGEHTQASCTLALSHVEANVTCGGAGGASSVDNTAPRSSGCRVARMRKSRRPHRPANFTPFEIRSIAGNFMDKLPQVNMAGRSVVSSPTEYYIAGSTRPFQQAARERLALFRVPPALFAQRLTVCWNSFWQAGLVPAYHTGGAPSALGNGGGGGFNASVVASLEALERGARVFATALTEVAPFQPNSTVATFVRVEPRYACRRAWLALLIAAAGVLLLSGAVGTWARYAAVAPDVLHYVSSLTRDNPFVPLAPGRANTLDGLERARLLKRLPVRLRDVCPHEPVGHIALALDDQVVGDDGGVNGSGVSGGGGGGGGHLNAAFSSPSSASLALSSEKRASTTLRKGRLYA